MSPGPYIGASLDDLDVGPRRKTSIRNKINDPTRFRGQKIADRHGNTNFNVAHMLKRSILSTEQITSAAQEGKGEVVPLESHRATR